MILHYDLPKSNQSCRLGDLIMDSSKGKVDPIVCWGESLSRSAVPVRNQNVESFSDQSTNFIISMAQALKCPNQYQIQSKSLIRAEAIKIFDIVAGPDKGIMLNYFILNSQKSPNVEKKVITIFILYEIFQGTHSQVADLQNFNCFSVNI